jgi:hypothetical protein
MKILKNLLSLRSNRNVREAEKALHAVLIRVIEEAVKSNSQCDADADAEKAAKAFAKGLAAFASAQATSISEVPPSGP